MASYLSEYENLDEAISELGPYYQELLYIDADTTICDDLTVPSNIAVVRLHPYVITTGAFTLTFEGSFESQGMSQCFDVSAQNASIITGTAPVVFSDGTVALAEWFGAEGDDSTDDTVAIQAALNSTKAVRLLAKTYLAIRLHLNEYQDLGGAGMYATTIKLPDNTTIYSGGAAIRTGIGTFDSTLGISIHDLAYDGNESNNTSWQGAISGYAVLRAGGIEIDGTANPTPAYLVGPEGISIYNVYVHDCIRSNVSIHSNSGHLNVSNIHLKNSALDHHIYLTTSGPASVSNVLLEGFCRGSMCAVAGVQMTNVTIKNTVANPYAGSAHGFTIASGGTLFNCRMLTDAYSEQMGEGCTINGVTAYVDNAFIENVVDIGVAGNHYGHNFTNFKIFLEDEASTNTVSFCKVTANCIVYGLNIENILVKNATGTFRFLYGEAAVNQLTVRGVYLSYWTSEAFAGTTNWLFRPTGDSNAWLVDGFRVETGHYKFCQFSSASTGAGFAFKNIRLEDCVLAAANPVLPQGTVSDIVVETSKFNATFQAGTAAQETIRWRDCTFASGLSNNAGTLSISGDGGTTQFTIAHGLCASPRTWYAVYGGSWGSGLGEPVAVPIRVSKNATNLTLDFETAPASGTDNCVVGWAADICGLGISWP